MRSVLPGYYSNLAKMARHAPPSNRQAFSSIDEYAEALGHRDLRIMALGRERAPWEMSRVNLDGILVRSARDGGPCLIEAGLAADGVALLVGINAVGKMGANGAMFGRRSVMVIPARSEVRCTSLDSLEWLSVFIPTSRFDSTTGASISARACFR